MPEEGGRTKRTKIPANELSRSNAALPMKWAASVFRLHSKCNYYFHFILMRKNICSFFGTSEQCPTLAVRVCKSNDIFPHNLYFSEEIRELIREGAVPFDFTSDRVCNIEAADSCTSSCRSVSINSLKCKSNGVHPKLLPISRSMTILTSEKITNILNN